MSFGSPNKTSSCMAHTLLNKVSFEFVFNATEQERKNSWLGFKPMVLLVWICDCIHLIFQVLLSLPLYFIPIMLSSNFFIIDMRKWCLSLSKCHSVLKLCFNQMFVVQFYVCDSNFILEQRGNFFFSYYWLFKNVIFSMNNGITLNTMTRKKIFFLSIFWIFFMNSITLGNPKFCDKNECFIMNSLWIQWHLVILNFVARTNDLLWILCEFNGHRWP